MNHKGADIFVSYSKADLEKVQLVVNGLEKAGYSIYWDKKIRGGEVFSTELRQNLELAGCVVVLWSTKSTDSEFVWSEARRAKQGGKYFPVLIDNEAEAALPLGLDQNQFKKLIDWDGASDHPDWLELQADLACKLRASDGFRNTEKPESSKGTLQSEPSVKRRPNGWILMTAALALSLSVLGGVPRDLSAWKSDAPPPVPPPSPEAKEETNPAVFEGPQQRERYRLAEGWMEHGTRLEGQLFVRDGSFVDVRGTIRCANSAGCSDEMIAELGTWLLPLENVWLEAFCWNLDGGPDGHLTAGVGEGNPCILVIAESGEVRFFSVHRWVRVKVEIKSSRYRVSSTPGQVAERYRIRE
ncbi:MAG: toll/interleukin-1 receptor domain-containing protein [Acidobacteriota bacterium]